MNFYTRTSFRIFNQLSERLTPYFIEVKLNLKKARIKMSVQEYFSISLMTSFIVLIASFPVLSFLFGFIFQTFLFSFITAFTSSIFISVMIFLLIINLPRIIIRQRAREIDNSLPFASLYLATVASSKLPLDKTFKIFSKFSKSDELAEEVKLIMNDIEVFGIDVNTALERAISRTSSKNFKEILWGLFSTVKSGGDLSIYLKEKAKTFINEYRRKLYEFSHQLTVYIEVYLTAIVLGTIFFTIMTSILSSIGGVSGNIIILQFFLIFVFIPLISILFIIMVRTSTPGGE